MVLLQAVHAQESGEWREDLAFYRSEVLDPDYLTPLSYAEFAANSDPAMEKIVELINQAH